MSVGLLGMRIVRWGLGAGLVVYGLTGHAMSLQEYVSDSVQAHPNVRQQLHYYRQVAEDLNIAGSGWHPSIDLELSGGRYSTKSPSTLQQRVDYNSHRGALTLSQNLFAGFETQYQIEQNEARLQAAIYSVMSEANKVALDAARVYLNAIKERRLLALAEENVRNHEDIFDQIKKRYDSGAGRRSEMEQTEGRVARARASLIAQQNNLQDALTQVHMVLGRYLDVEELEDPGLPTALPESLETLIQSALINHPDLQVVKFNTEATRAEYQRSRSGNYPKVDLLLQKQIGENLIGGLEGTTDEHSAVILLSYNLYRGGADSAEQQRQISKVHEYQAQADEARRAVIETLRLAWMADATLREQEGYLEQHVDYSTRTRKSYREEFMIGRRELLDVLDAASEQNTAENRMASAQYDAIFARYRVYEAIGGIFPALDLDLAVTEDDIQVLALRAKEQDSWPVDPDRDADQRLDVEDECDNTLPGNTINAWGCHNTIEPEIGYLKVVVVPEDPETPTIEQLVEFVFDTTKLTPVSQQEMGAIIKRLRALKGFRIEIHAHTDALGSQAYNMRLAERRAQAVKKVLVDAGIEPERMQTHAHGQLKPKVSNATQEGRDRNRRVEFILVPEKRKE